MILAIYEAFGRSDEIVVTLGLIKSLHDVFSFRFTSNAKVKSVQLSDFRLLEISLFIKDIPLFENTGKSICSILYGSYHVTHAFQ